MKKATRPDPTPPVATTAEPIAPVKATAAEVTPPATATPANAAPAKATPTNVAAANVVPAKATPGNVAPAKATPTKKAAPAKAAPAKRATPAKRPPRKAAPIKAATPEPTPLNEPVPAEPTPTHEPTPTPAATVPIPEPGPKPAPAPIAAAEPTPEPESPGETASEPAADHPIPEQAAVVRPSENPPTAPEPAATRQPTPADAPQPTPASTLPEPWSKLIANPGHAPELLALAAVQTFGPRAQTWAAQTRDSYPTASNRALARLAGQQFTRFGSLGSIVGAVAGSYAPLTLLASAAVTHAELVLHMAAAYGLDPTDPQRAADLLVITKVYATRSDAEAALTSAGMPAYEDGGLSGSIGRLGRVAAAQSAGWAVLRFANRYFPGTSLLAAVLTSTASAQTVAARAEEYYKKAR